MTVRAQNYPELPEDPEAGEYCCPLCKCRVTVNSAGREFGHSRSFSNGQSESCPRRPDGVDPVDLTGGASA